MTSSLRRRKDAALAVTMGDPAGIGPEIVLKAAAELAKTPKPPRMVVLGDVGVMRARARDLGLELTLCESKGESAPPLNRALAVLQVGPSVGAKATPGRPSAETGESSYRYVVAATEMALAGKVAGVVTAPISKKHWHEAGHRFPGHSELLARLARVRRWRMMFAGENLRVALVTVHLQLRRVSDEVTRSRVYWTIQLLAEHLRRDLKISNPRITVLGLNPHAGEGGLFGDEEIKTIVPAINRARREGLDVRGPVAADTAFVRFDQSFGFDGVVAMYHDQGLLPIKTLDFERSINVTLGLPFVRTSPDHGTAFDIAGTGRASAGSMLMAIRYAWKAALAHEATG